MPSYWRDIYTSCAWYSSHREVNRRTLMKSAMALFGVAAVNRRVFLSPARAEQTKNYYPWSPAMRQIGFVLSHEQFTVHQLIEFGIAAEQAGFDLISTSDHFQPWQANEGHSGFASVTLAALGQRTNRIKMGTAV